MANPAAQEAAAKTRIITHMNNDHQDSLVRLLEHYCHLPSSSARNARLTDITYGNLTIQTDNGFGIRSYRMPILPAMNSWADARGKLVALDAAATAGLKRSNITVKTYAKPTGYMVLLWFFFALSYVVLARSANLESGSWLYDYVWVYVPGFARLIHRIQPFLLVFIFVAHGGETAWLIRGRLRNHTVPTFSRLWWTWVLSSCYEGFGACVRFDKIVEEETRRKEKLKH